MRMKDFELMRILWQDNIRERTRTEKHSFWNDGREDSIRIRFHNNSDGERGTLSY